MIYNYHFAFASQSFFLDQEPIEEILRERTQYYSSCNKDIDFWFVLNPYFLKSLDYDVNHYNKNQSFAAIVSLDKQFIQWLKLRLVFVYTGNFKAKSIFLPY
uniref:hypothetical protein Ycf54 n=1 Tax=Aphanocladia delicatula TaxID=3041656 RepID=UPI002551EFBC|nr:hypothetical protein Ycf54 [Aphanocladia delicatula]WGH14229.1 hypothetical protein Ycf54 [Aphanocladia delicatula]